MQTFAPYADPEKSMRVLDDRRLGKQRVETYQILLWLHSVRMDDWESRTMSPRLSGWNHPALKMWSGHERALLEYQQFTCEEWTARGFRDTCLDKSRYVVSVINDDVESSSWPQWWGDEDFHIRHRSNLIWKDEPRYGPLFPEVNVPVPLHNDLYVNYLEYTWPLGRIPSDDRMRYHLSRAEEILVHDG